MPVDQVTLCHKGRLKKVFVRGWAERGGRGKKTARKTNKKEGRMKKCLKSSRKAKANPTKPKEKIPRIKGREKGAGKDGAKQHQNSKRKRRRAPSKLRRAQKQKDRKTSITQAGIG